MSDGDSSSISRSNGTVHDSSIVQTILEWLRLRRRSRNGEAWRDTIEELIDEREGPQADIEPDERVLIKNILNLHDLTVEDVMWPRTDIVAIDADTSLQETVAIMVKAGHSRCPVYRGVLDDTIGMIHIKDIVPFLTTAELDFNLAKCVRRVLFAAPSMRVLDLLLQMRNNHIHMALVVDEYGGIDGLVTIEDLVEEIVGDIEDEHDDPDVPLISVGSDETITADARITIEEFENLAGAVLNEEEREELDTLGGLVFSLAGRVPGRGELIAHPSGLEFEIVDADPRRIRRLRIRNLSAAKQTVD
ncbi:MAG: HlyC/CorC family transporter [Alphaproteobacteria bacterium]|nr:HlyC/CorC family transporter [Alphaproteobacteria bacterium]